MADKNYYEILGVDRKATDADIKSAYRKLVKQYHPDLHPGDANAAAKFKEVNEANEVLSDPQKRAAYDYELDHPGMRGGAGGAGGFGGFSVSYGSVGKVVVRKISCAFRHRSVFNNIQMQRKFVFYELLTFTEKIRRSDYSGYAVKFRCSCKQAVSYRHCDFR